MLSNYFKIALRSLWKNRIYSFVNITGLAIGIAASVLILLFVAHEYSFDRFHKNLSHIYQVVGKMNYGGMDINTYAMSPQFGPKLKETSPEVIDFVRTRSLGKTIIESDADHRFFEEQFLFADPSLFEVFSFELIRVKATSLSKPNTVVITEETARKYFGKGDPIGEIITYDKKYPFEVIGLVKKAPSNSSFQFDFIASFSSLLTITQEKETYESYQQPSAGAYPTYLLVRSENSINPIQTTIKKITKAIKEETYRLVPFTETHASESGTQNSKIFLSIAILILVLALINYINLTTARGLLRAKEVGIRKTIGAKRSTLTFQFYLESALMTVIAFTIAAVLVESLIPVFLNTIQQDIDQQFLTSPLFISLTVLLFGFCILVSGGYPAIVLSQFKPADVLKGKLSYNGQSSWVRKGFIVFQFTTSIALIICSLVIQNQLKFMRNTEIGLNKDQIVVIPIIDQINQRYSPLKEDIRKLSAVKSVSASSLSLFHDRGTSAYFTKTPTTNEDVFINTLEVDPQFFSTLDIAWVKKDKDTLSVNDCVINEAALDKLKITSNDLGKTLKLGNITTPIEGIVKDFNYATLRQQISGMVIRVKHDTTSNLVNNGGALYVKLNKQSPVVQSIELIQKIYNQYQPESPFQYYFLDEAFNTLYKSEERLSNIFNAFTFIAIFIACLGLLGLITFNTERRTKEIGIRKILGASVQSIIALLSKEFILLVILSIAIATPLAWWAMHTWLQEFSYRTEIPLSFIAFAGIAAAMIALITIIFQALKAAFANPVDSLRNE